ncbi:MAG: hypothetical protein RMM17_02565 [Acidobacteriota bacterium]|nr:hypothetical protein [Blastocatellia bacterium]MDW8411550.1 hypothetical protein [Acidobacteriota bacterium]
MSNYYESEFLFGDFEQEILQTELGWANLVYVNPLTVIPKVSASSTYSENFSDRELTALYCDWQTRDSEIGYALVEQRQRQLRNALEVFRIGLDSRQRQLTAARARMQTLIRINATEQDTKLHYPKGVIDELTAQINTLSAEYDFLRLYVSRMAALYCVLQTVGGTGQSDMLERYCRLIGRSWRGLMKLRAFAAKFPKLAAKDADSESFAPGVVVANSASESPFATDIVVPHLVVAYLGFQLDVIAKLSDRASGIFKSAEQNAQLSADWPPAMQLLAAIVELFYFCSFEMLISSHIRAVEKTSPDKVWQYGESGWQQCQEQPIERTRRQAAETAQLLVESPAFLRCTTSDELTNLCQMLLRAQRAENPYGPYQSIGLAKSEDRDGRSFRHKTAGPLIAAVLDVVVASKPELQRCFYTSCGGPLNTLLGMANLDERAFGLGGEGELLERRLALKFLSDFWKRMGKARPVALLGEEYARNIYRGLSSIGESAPERSSLLSVHLTNVLGKTLLGTGQPTGPVDMLTALMLADQIRLIDLLDLSWQYIQKFLEQLRSVRTASEIMALITSNREHAKLEPDIAKRFNPKWTTSSQPLWVVIRSAAPQAWRFWMTLAEGKSVAEMLGRFDYAQALSSLFLPMAEVVRLLLLLETSSPVLAEKLKVDAETAATELLYGFAPFRHWPAPFGSLIDECIGFYFDQSIQHDAWLAFTESLKEHLRQQEHDLKSRQVGDAIIDVLVNMMVRLEANHPTPQKIVQSEKVVAEPTQEVEEPLPSSELVESDCAMINQLISELRPAPLTFLKLVSLWRYEQTRLAVKQLIRLLGWLKGAPADVATQLMGSPYVLSKLSALADDCNLDDAQSLIGRLLNEQSEARKRFEALVALPSIPFQDDREAIETISTRTDMSRQTLLFIAIYDTPVLLMLRDSAKRTILKLETLISEQVRSAEEIYKQIVPIGTVEMCASQSGLSIGSALGELDPIFHEPDKQQSARLMWSYAAQKLGRTLKLLQAQLPDAIIAIKV